MDPIAHTLVGATLAQTPLGRWSTRATITLVLGANAPDIDAVTMLVDGDLALGFRRGWTHGVLAMVVLPIVLTGLVLLLDRGLARITGEAARARAAPVLALAYLAVLTHPMLDWLNTYGIRLLMPFSGEWFYGDALFIVDPWVWLLAGATVVLANTRSRVGVGGWLALGVLLTALISSFPGVPSVARMVWLVGVVTIGAVRYRAGAEPPTSRVAGICLVVITLYIAAMVTSTWLAERAVGVWLAERDDAPIEIMAGPRPATPLVRNIVVVDAEHFHFLELDWLASDRIRVASPAIERGPRGPIVAAALAAPHVRGLTTWMRFPAFEVEELVDGYRVTVTDVRYARRTGAGIGGAVIELDRDLTVR